MEIARGRHVYCKPRSHLAVAVMQVRLPLQRIRITVSCVCLGLPLTSHPVAYLEAFLVQSAFTPRGNCSDMGVGWKCSTEQLYGQTRGVEDQHRRWPFQGCDLPAEACLVSSLRNKGGLGLGKTHTDCHWRGGGNTRTKISMTSR